MDENNFSDEVGDGFQKSTSYERRKMPRGRLSWDDRPDDFKVYSNVKTVKLPKPKLTGGKALWDILSERRSIREYGKESLILEELSQLLWAGQGVTAHYGNIALRTAPSAGALYPIETYIVANMVEGLPSGIYHYRVLNHLLELLAEGDFRRRIADACLGQEMASDAAVVFIWTVISERSKWKYGQRAYRYIYLEAGHIAENVALAAEAMDLGSCAVGALFDSEVNRLLNIDGEKETVVYIACVGRKAR